MTEVPSSPRFRLTLRKSAAVSPTVVHSTLMIQNQTVTSGTLLRTWRLGAIVCREVIGTPSSLVGLRHPPRSLAPMLRFSRVPEMRTPGPDLQSSRRAAATDPARCAPHRGARARRPRRPRRRRCSATWPRHAGAGTVSAPIGRPVAAAAPIQAAVTGVAPNRAEPRRRSCPVHRRGDTLRHAQSPSSAVRDSSSDSRGRHRSSGTDGPTISTPHCRPPQGWGPDTGPSGPPPGTDGGGAGGAASARSFSCSRSARSPAATALRPPDPRHPPHRPWRASRRRPPAPIGTHDIDYLQSMIPHASQTLAMSSQAPAQLTTRSRPGARRR